MRLGTGDIADVGRDVLQVPDETGQRPAETRISLTFPAENAILFSVTEFTGI